MKVKRYGRLRPEIESAPRGLLLELSHNFRARDIVRFTQVLIEAVGREKAADLIKSSRYNPCYAEGKAAAEKLGNPKDLDSFLNAYFLRQMPTDWENYFQSTKAPFWTALGYFTYRTPQKTVYRTSDYCFIAEAIKQITRDKQIREFLAENYCAHDVGWANGFNPDMKFAVTKNFLRGDDCCEFTAEVY